MLKKLLVIGLVCASVGLAQGNKGGGKKGGDDGGMGGGMGMPSAMNKLDKIAATLVLTKDQKKTVKTVLDDGAKEAAPLRDQIAKSRLAAGEAITSKKSDDEIKAAAKASSDISAKLTLLELQTFGKVVATLDEGQKANKAALSGVLTIMYDIFHEKNWNE